MIFENTSYWGKIRPEWELTLCCSRPILTAADTQRVSLLLREGVNWQETMAYVFQHGVASFVFKHLSALGRDLIPSVWYDALRQEAHEIEQLHTLQFTEMHRILEAFAIAGIPVFPYQVPVLGWLASRRSLQRAFVDLEFMIQQANIPRATVVLANIGYQPDLDLNAEERIANKSFHPWFPFWREQSAGTNIAFYTECALQYFPETADFQQRARSLKILKVNNRKFLAASSEDVLFMLCVHGTINFWDRLNYICDVSNLIQSSSVDWACAGDIATRFEAKRMLTLGVHLAHQVLATNVPSEVLTQIRKDVSVQWLANSIRQTLNGIDDHDRNAFERAAFRVRTRDSLHIGLSHLFHLTLTPIRGEHEATNRSRKKSLFFQPFYRPLRLLWEYGTGLRQRQKNDLGGFSITPQQIIDLGLHLADLKPDDVLYDLGCGEGQVVITAAKRFGARAVGIDINPTRISKARTNARRSGVQHLVGFLIQDAKNADISEATVVWLFVNRSGTLRLFENLWSRLRPGARIVSHGFSVAGHPADRQELITLPNGNKRTLFLWHVKSR